MNFVALKGCATNSAENCGKDGNYRPNPFFRFCHRQKQFLVWLSIFTRVFIV